MNEGGVPYAISNPPGSTKGWKGIPGKYSLDFEHNVAGAVEHFDVYGEVRTKYSQVYWTRNRPVPLPPQLVSRFRGGGVMAITGYEVDQVTHDAAPDGTSSEGALGGFACYPDCDAGDKSVPIYHAYNHHYFSWLLGKGAEVREVPMPTSTPNPTRTAIDERVPNAEGHPTSIVFKENPGGEYRKSYHGYPSGYAQLLAEPTTWVVEPMQIDTHNRHVGLTEASGYRPWHLPKQFTANRTLTQLDGGWSPLLECPCTDRISREVTATPVLISSHATCGKASLGGAEACAKAVGEILGAAITHATLVDDPTLPSGCLLLPTSPPPDLTSDGRAHLHGASRALYNRQSTNIACDESYGKPSLRYGGEALVASLGVRLSLHHNGTDARIVLSGPAGYWFGVGFDASMMSDAPYAIIVDGDGGASERRLASHDPGHALVSSITVVSSRVVGGLRTVEIARKVDGQTPSYFSIPRAAGQISIIAAVGSTVAISYHRARTASTITLLPLDTTACVCEPRVDEYIVYMNRTREKFGYECEDEPRGDMLRRGDGTGRALPNAACHLSTYHGGLECCKHGFLLTDLGQEGLIHSKEVDRYFLKWRYYFQVYRPSSPTAAASHLHVHHWVFLIDAQVNDYEEDNALYGHASIGSLSARITADQMCDAGCDPPGTGVQVGPDGRLNFSTITPLVITPHCHAPSCIREELWNEDSGEILCNVSARYGVNDAIFNERAYTAIPPCIYGHQPGLQAPFALGPRVRLRAVKYFNNTYRHLGQMAQWTGLAVYT